MYVHFFKRVIDILVALVLLPFFCVIYIALVPLYFFMDKGAMFYSGQRLGRYGKPFPMHKFRSMKVNAADIRLRDGSLDGRISRKSPVHLAAEPVIVVLRSCRERFNRLD